MKKFGFLYLFLIINYSFAQKQHIKQQAFWFRYANNIQLPKNFSLKNEIEERTLLNANHLKQHQYLIRSIAFKEFKSKWSVGIGFAFFGNSTNDVPNLSKLIAPEFRTNIDITYKNKLSDKWSIQHRYRIEGRFQHTTNTSYTELEDGFRKFVRFRYQIGLEFIPYRKGNSDIRLKLMDEIMINAGKDIAKNIFDQNRFIAAFQYTINQYFGLETSYIFWLQQNANGSTFYNRHIVRFSFIYNVEIKKKHKEN